MQDEAAGRRLADAFESEAWRRVRSLRFDVPDDTCRVAGEGWFLSTAPTAAPDAGMEPR